MLRTMDDVVALGGELHWYGPGISSIVRDNVHGSQREFFNFYGGKCAIEDVHNHRGDLSSTILKGGMRNHLYDVVPRRGAPFCMYRGKCVSACSAGRDFCCRFKTVEPEVELNETMYFDSKEGDSYFMDWRQYHWVELLTENTISHVTFGPVQNDVPTLVRRLSDESCAQGPGSAIDDGVPSNRPHEDEVWGTIEQVMAA